MKEIDSVQRANTPIANVLFDNNYSCITMMYA